MPGGFSSGFNSGFGPTQFGVGGGIAALGQLPLGGFPGKYSGIPGLVLRLHYRYFVSSFGRLGGFVET